MQQKFCTECKLLSTIDVNQRQQVQHADGASLNDLVACLVYLAPSVGTIIGGGEIFYRKMNSSQLHPEWRKSRLITPQEALSYPRENVRAGDVWIIRGGILHASPLLDKKQIRSVLYMGRYTLQ